MGRGALGSERQSPMRAQSLSQLLLLAIIFVMAPFALLGLTNFHYDPLNARDQYLASQSLGNLHEPQPSASPKKDAYDVSNDDADAAPRAHAQQANNYDDTDDTSAADDRKKLPRRARSAALAARSEVPVEPYTPMESSLWTEPIEDYETVDLTRVDAANRELYSLYKTPTDEWVQRGAEKLKKHEEALREAFGNVDDPDQRITLVTCLFDLGRDKLVGFKRGFDEYINRFNRIIKIGFPMIIFMEADKVSSMNWKPNRKAVIIPFEVDDLIQHYRPYFDRIEEIRFSELYKRQATYTGWLAQSPQASLKHYNLMVMTKIFMLRYGAELNPFHTQYHMFLDAGHLCGPILTPARVNLLRKHMGRFMVTYFDYGAGLGGESHGMPQKAYRTYVGPPYSDPKTWADKWCCRIVRGGIFGGSRAYIEAVADVYNEALAQTLADGYMGTEENIFGMTYYRFPQLFNAFKNEGGDNCAIMSASRRGGDDADEGLYTHDPDVIDQWHGWSAYDPEERVITQEQ